MNEQAPQMTPEMYAELQGGGQQMPPEEMGMMQTATRTDATTRYASSANDATTRANASRPSNDATTA